MASSWIAPVMLITCFSMLLFLLANTPALQFKLIGNGYISKHNPRPCSRVQYKCLPFFQHAGVELNEVNEPTFIWDPKFIGHGWRTGNLLSAYWNARAMASYGGARFVASSRMVDVFNKSWLQHLPFNVSPPLCPDPGAYYAGCLGCMHGSLSENFIFPAICNGAWISFRSQVQADTRSALMSWVKSNNISVPQLSKPNTVIQFRCADDTLIHYAYGPLAFSCYKAIPPDTRHIYVVVDPQSTHRTCAAILQALLSHLHSLYPNSRVSTMSGSVELDFITMWGADVLVRNSQSSYGLWAGFAATGAVWSAPMMEKSTLNATPDYGSQWNWLSCPILYPSVAAKNNLDRNSSIDIVTWLTDN